MSSSAATPGFGGPAVGTPDTDTTEAGRMLAGLWWIWLVVGIAWMVASLVILQFDSASITTIGVIIGCMFAVAAAQQFVLAALAPSLKWLWALFGVFFLVAALLAFINPEDTFAGFADILGFMFLTVGVWWTVRAFLTRAEDPLWWLGLISGPLMIVVAFWTSGQFFLEKAYTLLVFAGVWALLHGISDIVRAFQIRSLRDAL
jgi:uncharacterized membrane protein HdeD (DUF308 family)